MYFMLRTLYAHFSPSRDFYLCFYDLFSVFLLFLFLHWVTNIFALFFCLVFSLFSYLVWRHVVINIPDVSSWLLQLINDACHHLVLFTPWWRIGVAQMCWVLRVFSNSYVFIKTWFIFFYGIVCLGLSSDLRITLHTGQFIWKWNWIEYFFYIKHTCVWYITSAVEMYLPGYVVMKKKSAEMCWTCPQWPCQDVAWMVEVRG